MPNQFEIKAKENSVSGGTPMVTGVSLSKGDFLTINVSPDDKWSAGAGKRESNANGLSNPFGDDFGVFTHNGFSFLFGSLVGSLDGGKTFSPSVQEWRCPSSCRQDALPFSTGTLTKTTTVAQ